MINYSFHSVIIIRYVTLSPLLKNTGSASCNDHFDIDFIFYHHKIYAYHCLNSIISIPQLRAIYCSALNVTGFEKSTTYAQRHWEICNLIIHIVISQESFKAAGLQFAMNSNL